jgi:hypothetical protein
MVYRSNYIKALRSREVDSNKLGGKDTRSWLLEISDGSSQYSHRVWRHTKRIHCQFWMPVKFYDRRNSNIFKFLSSVEMIDYVCLWMYNFSVNQIELCEAVVFCNFVSSLKMANKINNKEFYYLGFFILSHLR